MCKIKFSSYLILPSQFLQKLPKKRKSPSQNLSIKEPNLDEGMDRVVRWTQSCGSNGSNPMDIFHKFAQI